MAIITSWDKFVLLLWKNAVLQWTHKIQLLVELVLPAVFASLLVLVRSLIEVGYKPMTIYGQVALDNLDEFNEAMDLKAQPKYPLFALYYTPKNDLLDIMVGDAARTLGMTHSGYDNAEILEDMVTGADAFAGIEFHGDWSNPSELPAKLEYALRFPFVLRTMDKIMNNWFTGRLFSPIQYNGPRAPGWDSGDAPNYVTEGFLPVQHALSMAFIRLKSGVQDLPEVVMQRFPYPAYRDDLFIDNLKDMLAMLILLSFVYPCICIARYITTEKEKQLKEVMKIMGLNNWIHWTAWFVKNFIVLTFSSILILILLKIRWTGDLAVFQHSDFTVVLFFFLIYIIATITFCFMIAPIFSKASTAAAVMGLLWFISYLPYTLASLNYNTMSFTTKLAWSLLSNTAMGFGFRLILQFEGTEEGLQWSNLFSRVTVDDQLTVGSLLIMMLISSVLHMIICLYIEQILPGKFGVARKWYFPFTRNFWCGSPSYSGVEDLSSFNDQQHNRQTFEMEPDDKHVGVQLRNLQKRFGDRMAVKGLTMNMFEDEITVLLGHNGAGKTTTISMLTGMFKPTAGTAIINGSDIRSNLEGARMSLGICPQHNVLFDEMSVANHLRFFSRMKGLRGADVEREVQKYLQLIDLENKANVPSSQLSGGMKRKLSICCALCGDTKVVLCDEPSSGMDPAARRQLWDLLQKEKTGRTLLLTTHFMDEADVLGDRIAIMCDGELKCYGTSFFLKKHYGSGYTLICVKEDDCVVEDVTALLALYIPGIEPKGDIGTELSYELPDQYSSRFEKMLGALEDRSKELHLSGYGVGITTMEEVFMKVGAETHAEVQSDGTKRLSSGADPKVTYAGHKEHNHSNGAAAAASADDDNESIPSNYAFTQRRHSLRGMNLTKNQWHAMMLKKMLYTWRNKLLFAIQNIMPIIFVIITVLITKAAEEKRNAPPMLFEHNQYPDTVTILERGTNLPSFAGGVANRYEEMIQSLGPRHQYVSANNITDYILSLKDIQARVNTRYVAAATVEDDDKVIAWLNNQPLHTAPLTVNLVHNAIARQVINEDADIRVINAPYPATPSQKLDQLVMSDNFGAQLGSNLCFCMCFLSSMYILFLIKERESRAKLLQFVSGVRVPTFWLTQYIWDFITFTFTCLVIMVTITCFQQDGFTTFVELIRYLFLLLVFVFAALPYTYVMSLFFSDGAMGFARTTILNIFMGMAMYLVVLIMSQEFFDTKDVADGISLVARIFPHFSLAMSLYNAQRIVLVENTCGKIELPPVLVCELVPKCCNLPGFFSYTAPGVMYEVTYMIVSALVFFGFLIIREYGLFSELVYLIRKRTIKPPPPPEDGYFNDDVERERQRILNMSNDEVSTKNLVMDRVTKYYSSFMAVNQVSLCVEEAECFGLLGVNGAGKTTTFKMLTGDEKISFGSAYVQGLSLESQMNQIYKRIGYCPQFDALLEDLTGREVLRIFCLLRGIHSVNIKIISEDLAKSLGFMKHIDKRTAFYSGGNKRKLSTAIALIGGPAVTYLDEPTTGMDPAARRQLWNVVCRVRDSGKSIVLTSHSMEECEALCTRLAIMVNGEFKCIGSTQHLKNKYSKGLVVKIKVHRGRGAMRVSQISRGSRYRTQESDDSVPSTPLPYPNTSAHSLQDGTDSTGSLNPSNTDTAPQLNTERSTTSSFKRSNIDRDDADVAEGNINDVKDFIQTKFPTAILQEEHQGMLTYYIPLDDIKWSKIFGLLERNRQSLNIEDYSISQTTLEEIFLEFAKFQREDPRSLLYAKRRRKRKRRAGRDEEAAAVAAVA